MRTEIGGQDRRRHRALVAPALLALLPRVRQDPDRRVKDSGFGRESPRWMIDDFTVVKTLLLHGVSVFGEDR